MRIQHKRVYDAAGHDDGTRVLVDRLWPRGLRKNKAGVDQWRKELAPSDELRRWFAHDVKKWEEFRRRYRAELAPRRGELVQWLKDLPAGNVTLLYAAKDQEHNNAVVLHAVLVELLREKRKSA